MAAPLATECPACGNQFMPDANFCRKCGMKRPGIYDSQLPVTTANQSFDQLDADGDGVITRAEWEAGVGSLIPVPPAAQPGATGGGGAVMRMRGKSYEVMGSSANVDGGSAPHAPRANMKAGRPPSSGNADGGSAPYAPPANMKAGRPPRQQAGGGGQTAYYSIADDEVQPNMKARPNMNRLATQDLVPPRQDDEMSDASEAYRNPYKPNVANAGSESGVDEHDWEALDRRLKAGERIGVSTNVLARARAAGGAVVGSPLADDDYYVPQTGMKSRPPPRGQAGGMAMEEDPYAYQPQSLKSRPPAGRNAAGSAPEEASYGAQLSPRPHRGQMEALNQRLERTAAQRQRPYRDDGRPSSANSEDLVRRLDKGISVADDRDEYRYTPDVESFSRLTPILLEQFRERLEGMSNEQIRQENQNLRKEIGVLRTEVNNRKEDLRVRGMQIAAH